MTEIPKDHPRHASLMARERLVEGLRKGWVAEAGLTAHGRGEAFDYLLGEATSPPANTAIRAAAALLLLAERPTLSLNGNVVALTREEIAGLLATLNRVRDGVRAGANMPASPNIPEAPIRSPAVAEVCLFHRTEARINSLVEAMAEVGVACLGRNPDAHIPGLNHARALCDSRGVGAADVVLVPLEDGDRAQALRDMGKQVITIDLNPLSRTARSAHITIVDELTRAVPLIAKGVEALVEEAGSEEAWQLIVEDFDNEANLKATLEFIRHRLEYL